MTYYDYLNAFHRYCKEKHLPGNAKLLYFELLALFNDARWPESLQVDNLRLMSLVDTRTERVAISARDIGRAAPQAEAVTEPQKPAPSTFQAHKGQRRKPGTGCVSQINDHLWEGRYSPIWPDGKKHSRNVYAHSEAECETLLAEMILEMKAEISAEKERIKTAPKAS